jgi:glycosyltransferase involved in cell wall biosynthesis
MADKNYPYKVSASIITYNQREYIGKAIESALMQEVNFPYEIIIGDDCSTDGT